MSQEQLYDSVYEGLAANEKTITFGYDCTDEVFDVFNRVLADHPELFWYAGSASMTKVTSVSSVTVEFKPDVFISDSEIEIRRTELERRVIEILSACSAGETLYDRLLLLHDILVDDTEYDSEAADALLHSGIASDDGLSQSLSAYGCLVNRRAVCSGYAAAFQLLAARLGAECRRIQGTELKTGAPHEWNLLCLDGEWYHADITWDDPVFSGNPADGYRSYDYFCVTSGEIFRNHAADSGQTIPDCTAVEYNYYGRLGVVLDGYDPDAVADMIAKQISNSVIYLKFPDGERAEYAFSRLFGDKEVFSVPALAEKGVRSLSGCVSDMGTVILWVSP